MAEKLKQYNLRSSKVRYNTQLPIHYQVHDDTQVLEKMLEKQTTPGHESSYSHDSDTDSEVFDKTYSEEEDLSARSYDKFIGDKNESVGTSASMTSDTQQVINQQILLQLSSISKRLDNIEQRSVKKTADKSKIKKSRGQKQAQSVQTPVALTHGHTTVDTNAVNEKIPTLESLKQNSYIQAQVEQRLKQIAAMSETGTENKIKSQRGGVEVMVKNRVKWPHEYVLTGTSKERVSYDNLTAVQWMAGFCRTMKDEQNVLMRDHMLDYVISLLEDASDFSWGAAKASHAVLLCRMEQGEIKNFSETEKIDRVRRANAQKHVSTQNLSNQSADEKTNRSMVCTYFNQGKCVHNKTHVTKNILYRHVCSACFASKGKSFPHPLNQCRSKSKTTQSKNE